ncbi:unnamed protein product, partial [Plutella xylostella]
LHGYSHRVCCASCSTAAGGRCSTSRCRSLIVSCLCSLSCRSVTSRECRTERSWDS